MRTGNFEHKAIIPTFRGAVATPASRAYGGLTPVAGFEVNRGAAAQVAHHQQRARELGWKPPTPAPIAQRSRFIPDTAEPPGPGEQVYRIVPANELEVWYRQTAEHLTRKIAEDLAIRAPTVHWFRAESPVEEARRKTGRGSWPTKTWPPCDGMFEVLHPDVVWVRSDLKPLDWLVFVTAHEVRHSWQTATYGGKKRDVMDVERDADRYAETIRAWWRRLTAN